MKDGFKEIVGRQVAAVVVARSVRRQPAQQVFLLFTDGTRFEIYGDAFTCCSGLDRGDDIDRYVAAAGGRVVMRYGSVDSWKLASRAIDKARR